MNKINQIQRLVDEMCELKAKIRETKGTGNKSLVRSLNAQLKAYKAQWDALMGYQSR